MQKMRKIKHKLKPYKAQEFRELQKIEKLPKNPRYIDDIKEKIPEMVDKVRGVNKSAHEGYDEDYGDLLRKRKKWGD